MSGGNTPEVDLALVFAVDSSGSVSNERMRLYIEGHAAAVTSPAFLAALANLPTGRAALAYVAWSNSDRQQYLVPWRIVDGPESAAAWAHALRTAVRPNAGFTSISAAIDFCHDGLLRLAPPAARRVIDLVADGKNNDGRPVMEARDAAVAAGITINGLPVLDNELGLDAYFAEEVVGGTAAFVLPVRDEATLLEAIRRKLLAEIASRGSRHGGGVTQKSTFFFEKKNQKTVFPLGARMTDWPGAKWMKSFCFFFFRKRRLFLTALPTP